MANMINSHNNNGGTNNGSEGGGTYNSGKGEGMPVQHLRDVCKMLSNAAIVPTGELAYDHIIKMMLGLDLQDDGIVMNHKIKSIETDFCNIVRDESMLCESMEYINNKALADGDTAMKFAMLFSSRNFDALAMKETKVRSAMLKILETNFINAETYRVHDRNRLYNSITLLGEYYHRVRLADNSPITILGESLLSLLTRELSELRYIDARLARLVLSQITLNGDIMRLRHISELTQLLYHIRRNLIEQPSMKPAVKALLIMTLDLYYSNFKNLGAQLEEMYTKYLIQGEEDEDNNNCQAQINTQLPQQQSQNFPQNSSQPHQAPVMLQQIEQFPQSSKGVDSQSAVFENGLVGNNVDNAPDSYEVQPSTKKWSEQVCEDSFCDEFVDSCSYDTEQAKSFDTSGNNASELGIESNRSGDSTRSSRRAFQPQSSPRPLKQQHNNKDLNKSQEQVQVVNEDRDETKPLPRWRTPRFNRRDNEYNTYNNAQNQQRRYSNSFDEDFDQHSVRSEGGSLRLYSINDRMKHSHERFERSTGGPTSGSNFNSIVNSNWDRQSQRDDRSERSFVSNYERGNYKQRGGHNGGGNSGGRFNNRNTYDKPPRFQKQQHYKYNSNSNLDNQKIHSDSWRRSNTSVNNAHHDENSAYNYNGPESESQSSSRARTLPRPAKSHMEGGNGKQSKHGNNFQRSQRYSSQSSLASEASSTLDRRNHHHHHHQQQQQHQHQRHRNFSRRTQHDNEQQNTQQQEGQSWNSKDESELVRNAAQQTAKYMNYLSSQK